VPNKQQRPVYRPALSSACRLWAPGDRSFDRCISAWTNSRLKAKRSLSPQKGEAPFTSAHSLGTDGDGLRAEGV